VNMILGMIQKARQQTLKPEMTQTPQGWNYSIQRMYLPVRWTDGRAGALPAPIGSQIGHTIAVVQDVALQRWTTTVLGWEGLSERPISNILSNSTGMRHYVVFTF